MKTKKTRSADLQNKRALFFEIGLVVALAACIAVFAVGTREKNLVDVAVVAGGNEIFELPPVTREPEKNVAAPIKVAPSGDIIRIVKNDAKITTPEIEWEDPDDVVVPTIGGGYEQTDPDDDIFVIVQKMPEFQGGDLNKFHAWVSQRIRYPQLAASNHISGKVILTFVIEKDGSLSNIEVLQSPDRSLAEEAIRVLESSPLWKPGMNRMTPARVKFTIPVEFRLE